MKTKLGKVLAYAKLTDSIMSDFDKLIFMLNIKRNDLAHGLECDMDNFQTVVNRVAKKMAERNEMVSDISERLDK